MKDRYPLRGIDRAPMPDIEDAIVGDVTDFDVVLKATQDMEAVIHLAGNPSGGAPWEDILQNNIIGTYNVFEAARQNGVRRIAFASRAGLLAPYPKDIMRTVDMTPSTGDLLFDQQGLRRESGLYVLSPIRHGICLGSDRQL